MTSSVNTGCRTRLVNDVAMIGGGGEGGKYIVL